MARKLILNMLSTALVAIVLAAGSIRVAKAPGDMVDATMQLHSAAGSVMINPSNSRYFQYRGKPFVSFVHQGECGDRYTGNDCCPEPNRVIEDDIVRAARYGNHFYMDAHSTNTRSSFADLYDALTGTSKWTYLHNVCHWAYDNDVMLSLIFWNFKWVYSEECWADEIVPPLDGGNDMVRPIGDPLLNEDLAAYGLPGVTRMDLHSLMIEKVVQSCWEYPNVTYNLMWEYMNVNAPYYQGMDPDGSFHRWWVDSMKLEGAAADPERLFSVENSQVAPSSRHANFINNEGVDGFYRPWWWARAWSYEVPLVAWEMGFLVGGDSWDDLPLSDPDSVRTAILQGFHPSEKFYGATSDVLNYFLQARWYHENIETWEDEPGGDEINDGALPHFVASTRPTLVNPPGYSDGIGRNDGELVFSAVYADADGDAPAQAEVWVDRNGDGRFDPDPGNGERITMEGSGSDYVSGVTYSASGVTVTVGEAEEVYYVFRFADRHWYPPDPGGVVPKAWYDHWAIVYNQIPTMGAPTSTPTLISTPTPTPTIPSCPNGPSGNLNCDSGGLINGTDLSVLLTNWHPSSPVPTPKVGYHSADLNSDNKVDGTDLSILLSNWRVN